MSAASNGRVLRIALGASLAVHLVFAAVVYSQPVTAAPQQTPKRLYIIHLPAPAPTPQPPKPALPHPQHNAARVRPAIHVAHVPPSPRRVGIAIAPAVEPSGDPNPWATSGPQVAPTSAPVVATPTPKPACSAPDVAAKTLVTESPDVPQDPSGQGYTGTAKVKVDLDASGNVLGTSIYESTGSMELDRAALDAARSSRYAPEERDCKNVSGSYLFTVDFQ